MHCRSVRLQGVRHCGGLSELNIKYSGIQINLHIVKKNVKVSENS